MKSPPEEIDTDPVVAALADGWGFDAAHAEYAAVGAGSYHWIVRERDGTPAFVTVDDLDAKAWLGADAFAGLRRAFDTAVALREAGLEFVVAPLRTTGGDTVRRLGRRHAVALFPFVNGAAGEFGTHGEDARGDVIAMLAVLHGTAAAATPVGLEISGRERLEAALREIDSPWSGGPLAEPGRRAFAAAAPAAVELLALADGFAADVESRGGAWVVTHGEPHAGNVIRTANGLALVDWDTVALAPPERDLWMVVENADDTRAYAEATGRQIDETALSFYRAAWDLNDLASYVDVLRRPHTENDDTAFALEFVTRFGS